MVYHHLSFKILGQVYLALIIAGWMDIIKDGREATVLRKLVQIVQV
jgi:hypothetical protein